MKITSALNRKFVWTCQNSCDILVLRKSLRSLKTKHQLTVKCLSPTEIIMKVW